MNIYMLSNLDVTVFYEGLINKDLFDCILRYLDALAGIRMEVPEIQIKFQL